MPGHILGSGSRLFGGLASGEDGWTEEMNLNLVKLSVGYTALAVESRTTALPGGTIPDGATYICEAGEGTGFDEYDIAVWSETEATWTSLPPIFGLHAYVIDEEAWYWFNGTLWEPSQLAGSLIRTESGATFDPTAVHMGTFNRLSHGTGCLVTLPDGIEAGREIHFDAAGAGIYTFAATGGVLYYAASRDPELAEQYAVGTAKSLGGDDWLLFGALKEAST